MNQLVFGLPECCSGTLGYVFSKPKRWTRLVMASLWGVGGELARGVKVMLHHETEL